MISLLHDLLGVNGRGLAGKGEDARGVSGRASRQTPPLWGKNHRAPGEGGHCGFQGPVGWSRLLAFDCPEPACRGPGLAWSFLKAGPVDGCCASDLWGKPSWLQGQPCFLLEAHAGSVQGAQAPGMGLSCTQSSVISPNPMGGLQLTSSCLVNSSDGKSSFHLLCVLHFQAFPEH